MAEWQTRNVQGVVGFCPWRFDSSLRHKKRRGGEIGIHAALRWLCLKKRAGSSPVLGTNMGVDPLDSKIYVGQKAFINKDGRVLVLRDAGDYDLDFPGGKYRWGGSIEDELKREVSEETGLEIIIGKPFITWTAEHGEEKNKRQIFLVGYLCEYKSGDVKLSEEHTEYEWVDKNSCKKWKEDSDYYKALEEYFKLV